MLEITMNVSVPDLTPPSKKVKTPKEPTAPKEPKVAKEPKEPKEPKGPRAPRADYGFSPDSTILIVKDKENKYRGQRKDWYDSLVAFDGKKVGEWLESRKDQKDPPRGWLRFFVQDKSVELSKPDTPASA